MEICCSHKPIQTQRVFSFSPASRQHCTKNDVSCFSTESRMQTSREKFCLDYITWIFKAHLLLPPPPLSSKFVLWPSGNTTLDKRTDSSSFHIRLHKILQDHKSYGKTEMKFKKKTVKRLKTTYF